MLRSRKLLHAFRLLATAASSDSPSTMATIFALPGGGRMLSSCAGTQLPASRLRPGFAVHAIGGGRAAYRQQRLGMMCMAKGRDMSAQAAAHVLEGEAAIEEAQMLDHDDGSSSYASAGSLEEEFEAVKAEKAASLASLFEGEDLVQVDAGVQDESLLVRCVTVIARGRTAQGELDVIPRTKLVNCGLSDATVANLEKKGITALFPIQKHVFEPAMEGRDLIGRARTGSGKTLAFALPVIESLVKEDETRGGPQRGRLPRCIVLAPTRELAQQVEREFEGAAPTLTCGVFYGGVPLGPQISKLNRGCDVVVGTPGRIIDLIENSGALNLSQIRFAILDEADRMLSDGFEEDVERILATSSSERQTLLFSATMPTWVKKLSRQFQRQPLTVDLVGDEEAGKMAETIKLLACQVSPESRVGVLKDLLTVYGGSGKSIIFTETKRECDAVCAAIAAVHPCEALHGDISQAQREKTLSRFRDGATRVLVATNVAARGLDVPAVDLVVHYELPRETENFLHRSGRTGRAGRSGTAIAMFMPKEYGYFKQIIKQTRVENCEVIAPPAPRQVMESAAKAVVGRLDEVAPEVLEFFEPAARIVMASPDPMRAMAAALATLSGITERPLSRSLLTQEEGKVTVRLMSKAGRITQPGHIVGIVRNTLGLEAAGIVGRILMLREGDSEGAAFDLPEDAAMELLAQKATLEERSVVVDRPKSLSMDVLNRGPPPRDGGFSRGRSSYGASGRSSYGGSRSSYGGDSYRGGDRPRGGFSGGYSGSRGGGRGGYDGSRSSSYSGSSRSRGADSWGAVSGGEKSDSWGGAGAARRRPYSGSARGTESAAPWDFNGGGSRGGWDGAAGRKY